MTALLLVCIVSMTALAIVYSATQCVSVIVVLNTVSTPLSVSDRYCVSLQVIAASAVFLFVPATLFVVGVVCCGCTQCYSC